MNIPMLGFWHFSLADVLKMVLCKCFVQIASYLEFWATIYDGYQLKSNVILFVKLKKKHIPGNLLIHINLSLKYVVDILKMFRERKWITKFSS